MARWEVASLPERREGGARPTDPDVEYHYIVPLDLTDDGDAAQVAVEYIHGAPGVDPEDAVRPYLDHDRPPRYLLVDPGGRVTVPDA